MMLISPYLGLIKFGFSRLIAYPFDLFLSLGNRLVIFAGLWFFWSIISKEVDLNILELLSYFLIVQGLAGIMMTQSQKYGAFLRDAIKRGEINNYLIKPIKLIPLTYSIVLGRRLDEIFMSFLFLCLGLLLYGPITLYGFFFFLIFTAIAILLSFAVNLFEGMLAFFIVEPKGVMNFIAHLIKIFSGFWIPLYFFPDSIGNILYYLPFRYMLYEPFISLQITSFNEQVLSSLIIAICWALFLNLIIYYFWLKGLKKYDAIGI